MAKLIMYEDCCDRKIYYECNKCGDSGIEEHVSKCPNCDAKITGIIDEVEITHNHNEALKALNKDPNNELLHHEVVKYGMQRLMVEMN